MLRGIDPLLSGELLKALDEMGHADRLMLVDRNYPAAASGRPVIRLGEVGVVRAARAILSVFPLDDFVDAPLARMEVDDDPAVPTAVQGEVWDVARAHHLRELPWHSVPRQDFYGLAREMFLIVHTLEDAPYSCFVLQKGVVTN